MKEFIWAINGEIEVNTISKDNSRSKFILNNSRGLFIPERTWSKQVTKTKNTIYCVACSDYYDRKITSEIGRFHQNDYKLIMKIDFFKQHKINQLYKKDLQVAIENLIDGKSQIVLGDYSKKFEDFLLNMLRKYCAFVSSGIDAISIALRVIILNKMMRF